MNPPLKIKKQKIANVPRFLYFLVWCGAVWGDRFIITPSEFFKKKGTFYFLFCSGNISDISEIRQFEAEICCVCPYRRIKCVCVYTQFSKMCVLRIYIFPLFCVWADAGNLKGGKSPNPAGFQPDISVWSNTLFSFVLSIFHLNMEPKMSTTILGGFRWEKNARLCCALLGSYSKTPYN